MRKLYLPLLLAAVLAVAAWHVRNRGLPSDDAANYAVQSYEQYLFLTQSRGVSGLRGIYEMRGWRPTLFPSIAVPSLLLFKGDVVAAIGATQTALFAAWVFLLYAFLRRWLDRTPAALAAIFVTTNAYIVQYAFVPFSEMAWLVCCTGFLTCLLRSDNFVRTGRAALAGLFCALAMLIRPAESVLSLSLPLLYAVWRAARVGTIGLVDIVFGAGIAIACAGALVGAILDPGINRDVLWPAACAVAIACAFLGYRLKSAASAGYMALVAGICAINLIWWADWMPALYAWVQTTSFGAMAKATEQHARTEEIAYVLRWIASQYVSPLVVFVGALGLLRAMPPRKEEPVTASAPGIGELAVIAGGSLLLPLLAYAVTATSDPRRVMVGMAIALVALSVVALRPGALLRLRTSMFAVAAGLQVGGVFFAAIGDSGGLEVLNLLTGQKFASPKVQRDMNLATISKLRDRSIPSGSVIAVYTLALYQVRARAYEPAALELASKMEGEPYSFLYFWDEGDFASVVSRLSTSGVQYLLLDTLNDSTVRVVETPYIQFTSALLDRVSKGAPEYLSAVSSFELGGRQHLLFKINDPRFHFGATASRAIVGEASSEAVGYPAQNLIDRTGRPWGSGESDDDIVAWVGFEQPWAMHEIRIWTFSLPKGAHLRDVRIVASNDPGGEKKWRGIQGRPATGGAYASKVTLAALPDMTPVDLEIDGSDANYGRYRYWGLACLRKTLGDECNYLGSGGKGMYIRELEMR